MDKKLVEYYNVVDCENEGDIDTAKREVEKAGGIVDKVLHSPKDSDEEIDDYYESQEWTIMFHCDNEEQFAKTCQQLGIRNSYTNKQPSTAATDDDELEMLELEAEALKLKLALLDEPKPQTGTSAYPERNGNVSANDIKATFGFRYVNVDINLDEKQEQQMLNISYDTFKLLAQIIGKPMIAIGLGRNLTLNIGIKRMGFTTGGCYSPQYKALNFKSLEDYKHIAHEWLHALDHYLYYTYGKEITEKPNMLQSERMFWRPIARNEIRNAFYEVNACITRSDYQKRSEEVAKVDSNGKYWVKSCELLARAFEVWTDAKMRAMGENNNHLVSMFPHNPYPDFANPKDRPISAAFDALFAAFRMEKYPYDIESLR